MKHQPDKGVPPLLEHLTRDLMRDLNTLGVELSKDQAASAVSFLLRILLVNRQLNLTGISDPHSAVRLHLLDSLAAAPELQAAPNGEVLDLGSGGGFPGVPLSILSGRSFVLLDSVRKKSAAVQEVIDAAPEGIHATAVSSRAEELARASPGRFSVVIARAVAPLPSLVELASPLLKRGGRLIALKGQPSEAEMVSGLAVARITGMRRASCRTLRLPGAGEQRTIVVYEKVGDAQPSLPRRSGLAQHHPLA